MPTFFVYLLFCWGGCRGGLEGWDDMNNILSSQSSDLITNQILSSHNQF